MVHEFPRGGDRKIYFVGAAGGWPHSQYREFFSARVGGRRHPIKKKEEKILLCQAIKYGTIAIFYPQHTQKLNESFNADDSKLAR
jgi:hypothetical protein